MSLYRVSIEVKWLEGYCRVVHGFRAVSARHALIKAEVYAKGLPCYLDRKAAEIPVNLEFEIEGAT